MPNAVESLQMNLNPYLMGGSSITLMAFTGTEPEYSVEDNLNAVTANLFLNIEPEPINTPHHQIFKTKDSTLITYINQIFLNHIHENNMRDNLDQITHLKITMFTHKIQLIQTNTNQRKFKMKNHYHIIFNNMK